MQVLSVKNVSFSYHDSNIKAVSGVTLSIEKGSYTAIIGNNGSGKSTLARIICGLEEADDGTITVDKDALFGLIFQNPKNQIISGIVHRDTAIGPQNLSLSKSETELRVIESLNIVDMLDRAESSTMALSLGQTQKIALAGIIALRPNLLILDEPLSMVDPDSRKEIYEFLDYWHKEGNTIIHITHDKDAILKADNIIAMENGKITFDGKREDFKGLKKISMPKKSGSPKTGSPALTFKNVSFAYSEKKVLDNISFSIPEGSLVALTGESGSGKSTILELAAGLLKPSENAESQSEKKSDNSSGSGIFSSGKISLCQQNSAGALFETFAADDVAFGPKNKGIHGKELVQIVKDSMNKASLPYDEFGERHSFELSGGEQRRLAIAGILALDTPIVMFDEPTAGLDEESRKAVLQMMKNLSDEGKTVIFSTHKIDETKIADYEIKLKDGKISAPEISGNKTSRSSKLEKITPLASASTLENLRKISFSFNKKSEKNSIAAKWHPLLKIVIFLALFCTTISMRKIPLCATMLGISIVYCILARCNIKKILLTMLKITPFLLIFTAMQLFFKQSIWFCIAAYLRTLSSICLIFGFYYSTPEYDLIDGLSLLLMPLSKIKIPVRYLVLVIEIMFRFIPLLVDEASSIIKTQSIRGGLGEVKWMAKVKALLPLFVPLIAQTIKRAEALADALTVRCFR